MNTLVEVFHPALSTGSVVNRALAQAAGTVDGVQARDEYALYPNFQIDVAAEQEALARADRIVWQFPMYWYSSPALLKQWEDMVLSYGWAYGTNFALEDKELMIAVSCGADRDKYREDGEYGVNGSDLLLPFRTTARYTKMQWDEPFVVHSAMNISDAQVQAACAEYIQRLQ